MESVWVGNGLKKKLGGKIWVREIGEGRRRNREKQANQNCGGMVVGSGEKAKL